jgi:hypothetical protein
MIILEFDPGGKKHRNGAAIWRAGSKPVSKSFDCVDTTLDWFERELGEDHPTAAGIDTLLCWQTGPGGLREPDRRLQAKYRAVRSSIVAPNSLYGSMAIQGMAMAIRLRKNWPDIKLNETHPKVLYFAQTNRKYNFCDDLVRWLCEREECFVDWTPANEHEWDALISAWATYKGISGKWITDLMPPARDPLFPAGPGPATYFWPPDVSNAGL